MAYRYARHVGRSPNTHRVGALTTGAEIDLELSQWMHRTTLRLPTAWPLNDVRSPGAFAGALPERIGGVRPCKSTVASA